MSVAEVSSLVLLSKVCKRNGWALLLRTDGENAVHGAGYEAKSRMTCLDVVEPADRPGYSRRLRLVSGDLIARAIIEGDVTPALAAAALLENLGQYGLLDEAA